MSGRSGCLLFLAFVLSSTTFSVGQEEPLARFAPRVPVDPPQFICRNGSFIIRGRRFLHPACSDFRSSLVRVVDSASSPRPVLAAPVGFLTTLMRSGGSVPGVVSGDTNPGNPASQHGIRSQFRINNGDSLEPCSDAGIDRVR